MIPIARPILGEDELAAVKDVVASGMLAQGARVKALEEAFAGDVGRKHGIAVATGTAALHVALLAHGLKAGQEVVIPPLTFFATASTVLLSRAKPVFADVDRTSYNMDPSKAAAAFTRRTAAVMPVHLYGQTAGMEPIVEAAKDRGIAVIEDPAPAERPRADERPRRHRRPRAAVRRQLDGPRVLPVRCPAGGRLPARPRGDRPGAHGRRHRLPAVVPHAPVPPEGVARPADPGKVPGHGGPHPATVRAARPSRRRAGGPRADRPGGRGPRTP